LAIPSVAGQDIPIYPALQDNEFIICDATDFSSGGWLPDTSPQNLPDNGFVDLADGQFIAGRLVSTNVAADTNIGGAPPDTNKILNIHNFLNTAGIIYTYYRFTKDKIYRFGSSSSTNAPPNGIAANSGGDSDFFYFATYSGNIYFANGVDPIRQLTTVPDYIAVGNAPAYKYITSAFDRIIGVNLTGGSANQVGWSASNLVTEWNPAVDISAGINVLSVAAENGQDDLTGVFNYTSFLILSRQQSIWIAQHQNSATNPFTFTPILSDLGMDMPRTIQRTEKGLVWFNFKAGKVFYWEPPGGEVVELSKSIRMYLRRTCANAANPTEYFALYDFNNSIYSLFKYPGLGSPTATLEFKFNFASGQWSRNDQTADGDHATCVQSNWRTTERLVGTETGKIVGNYLSFGTSSVATEPTGAKLSFTHKLYSLPGEDANFNLARLEFYIINSSGTATITLNVYRDGVLFKTKSLSISNPTDTNKYRSIQIKQSIKSKYIQLTITSSNAIIEVTRITIIGSKSGVSQTGAPK
jgi:hypothetical protein